MRVQLTIEWNFTPKEWSDELEHIEEMKKEPRIVFGYDLQSSVHNLNSISSPSLKHVRVTE
tara:strand:+ start:9162 stop:9344 length:183 start_codon:yes stop_codon:yes gene_type:complete